MKLIRGAAAWLPLFVVMLALAACGGGSGGGGSPTANAGVGGANSGSGGGAAGPPPPPPPAATPAPSALSYSSASSYTVGVEIAPLDPTVTGTVTSYTVSPGFPAGISIDATTGRISGGPTAPARPQTYTVTASNPSGSTTFAVSFSVLNERVTTDRPDEKTGHQVHVMYVQPSDRVEDEQLDQFGTIEASTRIWNEWLAAETGGKQLRLDTYGGGKLDVTYLKLTRTDAEMNVAGSSVRNELEQQLYLHGFDSPDKVYLVYYDGDGDGCGRGAWPPTLPGNVGALYVGTAADCRNVPFAAGNQPPGFLEFLALHEALHVLGFAPSCAPHHTETGHVNDSVRDVMYSGSGPGSQPWQPAMLDVHHDDYYGLAVPNCLDLMNSAFLDPLPAGAEAPPGWPYADLTDLGCLAANTPGTLGVDTQIMFVNKLGGTGTMASIYELVPDANQVSGYRRAFRANVLHNDGVVLPLRPTDRVQEGAVFVVVINNSCARTVRATASPSRFLITN